jgi:hypothetical protein
MKQFSLSYNSRVKIIGISLSAIALILLLAVKLFPFQLVTTMTGEKQSSFLQFLFLAGLLFICLSEEKHAKGEIIMAAKNFALRAVFYLFNTTLLSFGIASVISDKLLNGNDLFFLAAISLFNYIFCFQLAKTSQFGSNKRMVFYLAGIMTLVSLLIYLWVS